jgi:hypothetical protein
VYPEEEKFLRLRFNKAQLQALQSLLLPLQRFVNDNARQFITTADPRAFPPVGGAVPTDLHRLDEQHAFDNLRLLLDMCVEAFSFLSILAEQPNFPKIIARLEPDEIDRLQKCRFLDFVRPLFISFHWRT